MKCHECHFENPPDINFCGKCGAKLHPPEEISVSHTKTLEVPIKGLTGRTTFAQRYEVIEELGRGGMGKVYKVLDKKIEENVALKLLKPEIASDEKTIKRFRNELKLSRKISHRNVCRMYDLCEEEGTHYITMEYVPGENLKSSLRRMGPLSAGKAVFIAKQVCEGLAEAHRLEVVHRDLKPQNIMIDREGNARIMDFGIARAIKAEGITGTGVMIGTPEYMSPEQVEGKDVDQRSDIYSLGVMLYEIVTGKVPFEGDTPLSIAIMHKSEEPRDPRELNRNISEDLSNVILRCMEKDREKRYQGAEELFSELIKIEKGMPTTEKILPKRKRKPEKTAEIRWKIAILHGVLIGSIFIIILIILMTYFGLKFSYKPQEVIDSIAVLPLKNLSGVAEKEYLAERMTRALIDEMTKTEALRRVTPITSVMQYKTTPKRLAEIGKELDVQAVVEWSMLLVGQKLRITIKLIDAKKEKPLWNKIYEQDMIDDLASQSELARTISHEIIVELTAEELPFLEKTRPDVKPKALQLYKKGRFYWNQRPYEVFKAQEYFTHAIQEDPKCALAYAGWADCDLPTPYNFVWHPKKQINWVKENIEKALEIDRYLGEACASQAWIKMYYEGDWEGAERQFKRAIMLNPNYTTAHQWYANYMMNLGRFDEARKEMERALELDPLSPIINCDLGRVLYYSSQYELAIEAFQKTIEIDPNFFLAYHYLGIVYIQKSMYDEALAEFQKEKVSIKERPTSIHLPFIIDTWIGITYLKMGKRLEVQGVLSELMKRSKHLWSVPYSMAILYFSLGERDEGFKWLKKAYEQRDYRLCLLKIDPVFDSIRSDPRFKEMLKKVGLER